MSFDEFSVGTVVGGYRVMRMIGTGSFGQVYLVQAEESAEIYVLKRIKLLHMDAEKIKQTKQEVELLKEFTHPSMVSYRECFVVQSSSVEGEPVKNLCIIMEYCDKGDLHQLLQQRLSHRDSVSKSQNKGHHYEPLYPESTVLDCLIQLCLALDCLHSARIMHRDIKTQNIFVSSPAGCDEFASTFSLIVKLGDFGIAKVLDGPQDCGKTQIGTPFYMSPELFRNQTYDHKSDIWGLGCIIFELIEGHHAFQGEALQALALKVLRGAHAPIRAKISTELAALVEAMLSQNPDQRPNVCDILQSGLIRTRLPSVVSSIFLCLSRCRDSSRAYATMAADCFANQIDALGLGVLLGNFNFRGCGLNPTKQYGEEQRRNYDVMRRELQPRSGRRQVKIGAGTSTSPSQEDWGAVQKERTSKKDKVLEKKRLKVEEKQQAYKRASESILKENLERGKMMAERRARGDLAMPRSFYNLKLRNPEEDPKLRTIAEMPSRDRDGEKGEIFPSLHGVHSLPTPTPLHEEEDRFSPLVPPPLGSPLPRSQLLNRPCSRSLSPSLLPSNRVRLKRSVKWAAAHNEDVVPLDGEGFKRKQDRLEKLEGGTLCENVDNSARLIGGTLAIPHVPSSLPPEKHNPHAAALLQTNGRMYRTERHGFLRDHTSVVRLPSRCLDALDIQTPTPDKQKRRRNPATCSSRCPGTDATFTRPQGHLPKISAQLQCIAPLEGCENVPLPPPLPADDRRIRPLVVESRRRERAGDRKGLWW